MIIYNSIEFIYRLIKKENSRSIEPLWGEEMHLFLFREDSFSIKIQNIQERVETGQPCFLQPVQREIGHKIGQRATLKTRI